MSERPLMDPATALARAIEHLRGALSDRAGTLDPGGREVLELSAHDVARALVSVRHLVQVLESDATAVLDAAAHQLVSARLADLGRGRVAARCRPREVR